MEEVTLAAHAGRPTGSRDARRLRRDGRIPAVLYGHGVDPVSLAVDARDLRGALNTGAGLNALITLEVGSDRHLAMARELQRHPVRGTLSHVDFVIVRRDEIVSVDVPVHLVGEADAPALREGSVISQELFSLPIKAKPGDIPPHVEVDVSGLTAGANLRVGDIPLPAGVTAELDEDATVVSAIAPTEVVEEEPEEAEVAEGEVAEGEAGAEGEAAAGGEAGGEAAGGGADEG